MRQNLRTRSLFMAGILSAPLLAGAAGCSAEKIAIGAEDAGTSGTAGTGATGSGGAGNNGSSGNSGSSGSGGTGNGGAAGTSTAGGSGSGGTDICALPKVVGPCDALIQRWWFNPQTRMCERFSYGGCEGNANNFLNLAHCTTTCVPEGVTPCGGTRCLPGQSCCNPSCGICTSPGEGCVAKECGGECAPMDAQGEGSCLLGLGVMWDGLACVSIGGCSCVGADCARVAPTVEQCESAHAACDDPGCANEQRALLSFIDANKACASAADCGSESVGCGVNEDDCTGAVYMNTGADLTAFGSLRTAYLECVGTDNSCHGRCARFDSPADCIEGRCLRRSFSSP